MPPNVLLLVLDTARRDALEPYGAAAGATPALADLTRRGRAVESAYSTACWTLPSHGSMFTGLMPRALGFGFGLGKSPEDTWKARRLAMQSHRDRLLPEVLRRAGYRTQAASTNLWISPSLGFDTGFDDFELMEDNRQDLLDRGLGSGWKASLFWAREGLRSNVDDGAAWAGEVVRRWIGDAGEEPRFWFVNLIECHSPYLPPRPWNDLGVSGRVRGALDARRYQNFETICRISAGGLDVPRGSLERMHHLYERAVSYMDRWLADVLDALDARGILDETLVVVTSDHGENFGENGLIGHCFSIDERLTHVPLVVAGPGAERFGDGPLSLASLPRLVAEAAGLENHPWPAEELPQGAAVAQFDPMAGADNPNMREFVDKWDLGERGLERLTSVMTHASDGRRKLLVRNGAEELYDLESDPLEERPCAAGDDVGALRAALEHPAVTAAEPLRDPDEPAQAQAEASDDELDQLEKQMKLLGYM